MSCTIVLNKPRIFHPGDTINGKVLVKIHHEEHIAGIRCSFRGREQVHWTEEIAKEIIYTGAQCDFLVQTTVLNEEGGYMKSGSYEYPFAFTLPSGNIPSPFVQEFGSIRYFVQAKVDRVAKEDYKDEFELNMEVPVTHYIESSQLEQLTYQVEKELGKDEYAALFLILEKDTYVLGDEVNFTVEIKNRSKLKIERVQAELATNIQFISPGPPTKYKMHKIPLSVIEDEGERKGYTRVYSFKLRIPQDVVLYNFSNCDLFKNWYTLKVEAFLPSPHKNMILEKNIKLGHVAVDDKKKYIPSAPTIADAVPSAPCISDEVRPNKDVPPPSYDEISKK